MRNLKDELNELFKYKDLFIQLIERDIKLKYRKSILGYFWSILNPLLLMIVLTAVFSNFNRSSEITNFPAYLICGQVLFSFMREATENSMFSIITNASLIKKVHLPKYIFAVSRISSCLITLLFSFIALTLVFIFTDVKFTFYSLLFFIPILQVYLFCIGLGLFLAQAATFFKDAQYLYSVVITAWMYATPIFYDFNILPLWLQKIIWWLNPMYSYIQQLRSLLLNNKFCDCELILLGCFYSIFALGMGIYFFRKNQDKFILYI